MHAAVLFVGESGFGTVKIMRQLEGWHWFYAPHQKSNHQICWDDQPWQDFGVLAAADQRLGRVLLTKRHDFPVYLLANWVRVETEPRLLATNLTEPTGTWLGLFS